MILRIFAVYDDKAKAYITPFFLPNADMAIRVFTDCVNDKTHQFGAHPADYTLFTMGTFDNVTGHTNVEQTEQVAQGLAVLLTQQEIAQKDMFSGNEKGEQEYHQYLQEKIAAGAKTTPEENIFLSEYNGAEKCK